MWKRVVIDASCGCQGSSCSNRSSGLYFFGGCYHHLIWDILRHLFTNTVRIASARASGLFFHVFFSVRVKYIYKYNNLNIYIYIHAYIACVYTCGWTKTWCSLATLVKCLKTSGLFRCHHRGQHGHGNYCGKDCHDCCILLHEFLIFTRSTYASYAKFTQRSDHLWSQAFFEGCNLDATWAMSDISVERMLA